MSPQPRTQQPLVQVDRVEAVKCLWLAFGLLLAAGVRAGADLHTRGESRWGQLSPGPFQVGFRSHWEFDYSRRYDTTFADGTSYALGKSARPILVNVWYPADPNSAGATMVHRDYLNLPASSDSIQPFATALASYNLGVIASEVAGGPLEELSEVGKAALDHFLDSPTPSKRDAEPSAGKFPLVLYHSGFGSSFEDNAVLCEYLASHGYFVVGSAFQDPTGRSFNVDGKVDSARDLEFLINWAGRQPHVNPDRIGIIGHSGGAHAALKFRAQARSMIDAVVSLDTTQDYYPITDARWSRLTASVIAGREEFTGPLLAVANPHAYFALFDLLQGSHRYYLTFRHLEHNDFIFQGVAREQFAVDLLPAADVPGSAPSAELGDGRRERLRVMRRSYESLNRYVLFFLQAWLDSDPAARENLVRLGEDVELGGEGHVEVVAVGAEGPLAYDPESSVLPSPRQLRAHLREHGSEQTISLLRRVQESDAGHPALHLVFAYALVCELLEAGRVDEARHLVAFTGERDPSFRETFVSNGDEYFRFGRIEYAQQAFRMALQLDPENEYAATRLREIERGGEK